jgi:hypothetical protein
MTAAALAGVLALAWGGTRLAGTAGGHGRGSEAGPTSSGTATTEPPPSDELASTTTPRPAVVTSAKDGLLAVGGARYRVGAAGDEVLVAPWGCGPDRALLLRRTTGDLYLFDRWATAGRPVTGRRAAHVAAGAELSATRDERGCVDAVATPPGRPPVVVSLAAP